MKNKKCEQIIEKYLQLDKNQRLPASITLHLLSCKNCRNKIRMLSLAEEKIKEPVQLITVQFSTIESVIQKISPETYSAISKKPISLVNWIINGILVILFLGFSVIFATKFNSSSLTFVYTITSVAAIVTYCLAFVISNIDFFVKKISFVK